MCHSARHHVLRHVGPSNPQDDIIVICKLAVLWISLQLLYPIQILYAHTGSVAVPSRRIWDF